MNITLHTQLPTFGQCIIPIVKTDTRANNLAQLAPKLGLSADVLQRDFAADAKETLAVYGPDGQKTYLLGLGENPKEMDWLRTFRKFFFDQRKKPPAQFSIDLSAFEGVVVAGVVLGVR